MVTLQQISEQIKSKGKFWISFVGDSITSCEWVHPNWREIVEYVLKEELTKFLDGDWKSSEWGIKTFNFGYDGATTKDILTKVEDIKVFNPDLVIVLMGGNDSVMGVSVPESIKNIKNISEKLNTSVYWCSSTSAGKGYKKNMEYEPYSKAFLEISDSENFQKIDMFNSYQKFDTSKFFTFVSEENPVEGVRAGEIDLQHPNQLGNAYIAKVILKEIFGIDFDPEQYWHSSRAGKKYPTY